MSCYCHQVTQVAAQDLAALAGAEPPPATPGAPLLRALSDWLGARALPAAAWDPDPAWLDQPFAQLSLSADALATISALAQIAAEAKSCLDLDITQPDQARAFTRVVATVQARAEALATDGLDQTTLSQLASTLHAADQTADAVRQGLFPLAPERVQQAAEPGGAPAQSWQPWLRALSTLAPLIAASLQLGIDLSGDFTAALAARLRTLRAINLPTPPAAAQTSLARATTAAAALAQLREGLGVDPLKAGAATLNALVAARARTALQTLAQSVGSTPEKLAALAPDQVVARLPAMAYCPTSLATPAVVQAAQAINQEALARLTWAIPPVSSLAVITVGLPATAFACRFQAATGLQPARTTPCGSQCDAARLTAAT